MITDEKVDENKGAGEEDGEEAEKSFSRPLEPRSKESFATDLSSTLEKNVLFPIEKSSEKKAPFLAPLKEAAVSRSKPLASFSSFRSSRDVGTPTSPLSKPDPEWLTKEYIQKTRYGRVVKKPTNF